MIRFRPLFRALSLALVAALALGGCSDDEPEDLDTILVANTFDPEGQAMARAHLDKLEREEGIKTKLVYIPWNAYRQKITTQLSAGKAPDVVWLEVGFYPGLRHAGALVGLSDFVKKDKIDLKQYYPQILERFSSDGELYALPQDTAPIACLFYNKTILREAGVPFPTNKWTWDDLLDAAKRLTKRDANGRVERWGFRFNYAADWMNMAASNGAMPFDDWRNPTRCIMDAPAFVEAVQFTSDLMFKHKVMPSEASRETMAGTGEDMFTVGRTAMFASGYWPSAKLRRTPNLDWDIAAFPMGPKTKDHLWQTGGSGWSVTRDAKDKYKAWRVVRHLSGEEYQRILIKQGYAMPAIKRVAASKAFLEDTPPANKKYLVEAPNKAFYTPNHHLWDLMYESVITPKLDMVMTVGKPAKPILEEVTREVNKKMFANKK